MRGFSIVRFAVAALAAFPALAELVAPATAGVAYLSRTGTGTVCTYSSPCSYMPTALTVAGAGGEVVCLDRGTYSGAAITQPVTISCGDGLWEGWAQYVTINLPAGGDVVIEGLLTDGAGYTNLRSGVTFTGQGTLHLRQVRIGNSSDGSGDSSLSPHGLNFAPSGPAQLIVSNSAFYNMSSGTRVAAGIAIKPSSGVTAKVSIERSTFENNNFGIIADGTGGGIIRGAVKDSFVSSNRNNGITVSTTTSSVVMTVDNTLVTGNAYGLVAGGGANAGMLVRRSVINANTTGLYTNSGAALYSYRDNSLNSNFGGDGAFTGAINLQ